LDLSEQVHEKIVAFQRTVANQSTLLHGAAKALVGDINDHLSHLRDLLTHRSDDNSPPSGPPSGE